MVVMVQYWDEENEVRTCYLGSTFLRHSTVVDLKNKLNEVIKHLDPENLYQISMDGLAVNIKFLNEFKLKQEENAFHSKIDRATRWVENKLVAEYMIEVWPNLIKLINFWTSVPKSKQPTCKSYENVCDAVQDPFMISKLTFFSFVCGLVEPI